MGVVLCARRKEMQQPASKRQGGMERNTQQSDLMHEEQTVKAIPGSNVWWVNSIEAEHLKCEDYPKIAASTAKPLDTVVDSKLHISFLLWRQRNMQKTKE